MTQQNPNRSPCMESLEGRLLLDGDTRDIWPHKPKIIYEGKPFLISVHQPADYLRQVESWHIVVDGKALKRDQQWDNTHIYLTIAMFGTHDIDLTATRHDGTTYKKTFDQFDVLNVRPAPKLHAYDVAVPNQPVTIRFNPGDSAPTDTLLVSWNVAGKLRFPQTSANVSEAQSVTYTFTKPGTYTVTMTTRDGMTRDAATQKWIAIAGGGLIGTTTKKIRIVPVAQQPDSKNPALTDIVVGGTDGNDIITFQDRRSAVEVFLNGHSYGLFNPTGRLVAFGGAGDDVIAADTTIDNDVVFYGGDGNDTLAGGAGTNELFGDAGTNKIIELGA